MSINKQRNYAENVSMMNEDNSSVQFIVTNNFDVMFAWFYFHLNLQPLHYVEYLR